MIIPPSSSRNLYPAAFVLFMVSAMLFTVPAIAQTTPEGPVPVPCCPENGMACSGGDDCINGICQKVCGNNPFTQDCDCQVSGQGGSGTDGVVIIVVIGVIGAVALGGAVLVAQGRKKASAGKEDEEKKKSVVYILQLSTNRLTIGPDRPGELGITVWKQEAGGPLRQAPEAGISIQVPAPSGLRVIPATGQGTLAARVSTEGPVRTGEVILTVTAAAGGTAESAQVTVVISQDSAMEFF